MRWLIALLLSVCAWAQTGPMLPDGIPFASTPTGTFTFVQHNANGSCSSGTTCSITLGSPITAGDLVIVAGDNQGGASALITGTNNGGSFVQCVSCTSDDWTAGWFSLSGGYIISASSQASPLVVNLSTTSTNIINMWEYSYTGGTPALDGANVIEQLATSSLQMPLFTTSGTGAGDISVQFGRDGTVNSISSPFATKYCPQTYACFSHLASAVSGSIQPTWTLNASSTVMGLEMHFGFGVTSFSNETLIETSGTSGSTVTAASLKADTFGFSGGIPSGTQLSNITNVTYQATPTCGGGSPPSSAGLTGRLSDGGNYSDTSTTVIEATTTKSTYARYGALGGLGATNFMSAAFWYCSNLPAADTSTADIFTIQGTGNSDFSNVNELASGASTREIEIECPAAPTTQTSWGNAILARAAWYWIDILYNKTGNHTMKVYNSSLVQVGTTISITSFTGSSGTLTFTNSGINNFITGSVAALTGFTGANTGLNGQVITILAAGLNSTTFEAAVTGSGYSSGSGTTSPTIYCPSEGTTTPVALLTFGDSASNAITSGYVYDYYHVKYSLDGTDPLQP